jgi:hypothetical protein
MVRQAITGTYVLYEHTFSCQAPAEYPLEGVVPTLREMLERAQIRALPLLNKGVDLTPTVNACCGACRTCVTTNVVGVGLAALSWIALRAGRLVKRRAST